MNVKRNLGGMAMTVIIKGVKLVLYFKRLIRDSPTPNPIR
jgi:hypothetical protein